ncbi:MAG: flagellar accessory protein FlaH [Dehalococcoidales bacterium]|jgi:flagellar protein FlaH|nr:flagellar accessory protein FlaH [Dehalococcoidales bacterium]
MAPGFFDDDIEEEKKDTISTGHPEIDKKLGGGIPVGSLVLVEGQSDAGKSVFCQQIIWGSLHNNFKVAVFTTENTVRSLVPQMRSLGLEIIDHLLLGWCRIYPMKTSQVKGTAESTYSTIISTMQKDKDFDLFIVDALTPIVSKTKGDETLVYLENCKNLCDKGKTVLNVTHTYAFEQDFLIRIRSVCDAHFKLMIEKVGDKLVKTLEVSKIRGAAQSTGNILSFDVEPEIGMKIMPMSRAKA